MSSYDHGYVCDLSEELIRTARVELHEDPDRRDEDIEALREWLLKQPHIIGRTDSKFLLMFLRNTKFSLEAAKKKIDDHYTIKSILPEWFSTWDPLNQQSLELLKLGRIVLLGYDDVGRRLTLLRLGCIDYNKYSEDDLLRLELMYTWHLLNDEQTQIHGAVTLFDFEGTTTRSLLTYTPVSLKKIAASYQDCIPIRLRKFIIWNSSPIFDVMYSILKVFAKPKLLERVWKASAGTDIKVLHSQISPKYLPTEYGGTAGDLQEFIDNTIKSLMDCRQEILNERKYYLEESKRPGKPKTHHDILGIEGSFRKLTID